MTALPPRISWPDTTIEVTIRNQKNICAEHVYSFSSSFSTSVIKRELKLDHLRVWISQRQETYMVRTSLDTLPHRALTISKTVCAVGACFCRIRKAQNDVVYIARQHIAEFRPCKPEALVEASHLDVHSNDTKAQNLDNSRCRSEALVSIKFHCSTKSLIQRAERSHVIKARVISHLRRTSKVQKHRICISNVCLSTSLCLKCLCTTL